MGNTKDATEDGFDPCSLNGDHLILWFDDLGTGNDEYRFLSNFYSGDPIILPGIEWQDVVDNDGTPVTTATGPIKFKTGEHAFAAMKFFGSDPDHFRDIVNAEDPNAAKALGRSRKHVLRADWEVVKLDIMAAVTREKYALGRPEADLLLATGDRLLVEGTFWYDEVWGVDLNTLQGRNWLGTLLMARRAELKAVAALNGAKSANTLRMEHFVNATGMSNLYFGMGDPTKEDNLS